MILRLKRMVYPVLMFFLKILWKIRGGRKITIFGQRLKMSPETAFRIVGKKTIPKNALQYNRVHYTDAVQMNAIVHHLSMLPERATVIEVGAYQGLYAVLMGSIVKKNGGQVIAVEPNPKSFATLRRNIALNSLEEIVFAEPVAIFEEGGEKKIVLEDSESRLCANGAGDLTDISAITMKDLLEKYELKKMDLLMIDVEGAELNVLRSIPWEACAVDKLFVELHPYAWAEFGYGRAEWVSFLHAHDLRCLDMFLQELTGFEKSEYVGPTLLIKNRKINAADEAFAPRRRP